MTTGRHDRISLYFLLMNSIGRTSGILKRGWTSWPGNCSRSRPAWWALLPRIMCARRPERRRRH